MLKVEDGCVNFCSYCIIPYARGPVRSLPLDQAAEQAAALAAAGYREIVLTGIEISSWGRDLEGRPGLADLIEAVCAAAPGVRVRLGSLEPRTVTEAFCRRCADLPDLCPQFHLSLQSGCDETLRRMNRHYDRAQYLDEIRRLRALLPDIVLTSDVIVGFPGETTPEFEETLTLLEEVRFDALFTFLYSPRPGTPAAKLDDLVNWLPARLTALLMAALAPLAGLDGGGAWKIWWRDRRKHKSPNSAQTEAAMAGALGVELAGDAWYFGELHKKPTLGDSLRPIQPEDIRRANRLLYGVSGAFTLLAAALRLLISSALGA